MSESNIAAQTRTEFGKGAARRIRRAAMVPAVLYGHGQPPVHLSLPGHDTMLALKHGGANALLTLTVEGSERLALAKDVQRDPIKGFLEHLDLVVVRRGEKVTVEVPVHVEGEAAPETLVVTELSTVTLEAEATHIPEYVLVDIEGVEAGHQVFGRDLQVPAGSTVELDDDALVVNVVHAPTAEEIEAELEEAEAEAGIERDESELEPAAGASAAGGADTDGGDESEGSAQE